MTVYYEPDNTPQKKALRERGSKNSLLLICVLVFTEVIVYASVFLLQFSGVVDGLSESTVNVLNTILSFFPFYIAALVMIIVGTKRNGYPVRSFLQKPQLPTGQIIMLMVVAIGLSYAVNLATVSVEAWLESAYGIPAAEGTTIAIDSPLNTTIQFVSYCLITPFVEEMLFRGVLLSDTLPFGGGFAVVTTAVSFALYHMDLGQMPFAFTMGLVCGYLTVRCRSLLPSIGVHFFINTCSLLSNTLGEYLNGLEEITATAVLPAAVLALVQVLILFSVPLGIILAVANRKKLFPKLYNSCKSLTAGDKGVNYWFAPWSVVFLVVVAATIIFDWLA